MAANTRFATGVHVLVLLALHPDSLQTSADLAAELNTNPVVIRRILSSLQQARLIQSQKGPSGGSRLLRSPKDITLADVFEAVEANAGLHVPSVSTGNGTAVNTLLEKAYAESLRCLKDQLDRTTVAQLVKRVGKASRR